MNSNLRIAVISGGTSAEASVSRVSAKGVTEALSVNYRHIVNIELDGHLTNNLQAFRPDIVFPVLHGPPGEGWHTAGLSRDAWLCVRRKRRALKRCCYG